MMGYCLPANLILQYAFGFSWDDWNIAGNRPPWEAL
jgi:hypothetical protein